MWHQALLACILSVFVGSAAEAVEKWGPFRGQLVDVETGQPIEGAAIIVVWYEAVPSIVQTNQRFYDAVEAVTDANGRFEVPRRTPAFFSFRIFKPHVIYFAVGYDVEHEIVTPPDGQRFVAPTVVQMRRVKTKTELLGKSRATPVDVPDDKMVEFIKALNRETDMLGLPPLPVPEPSRR